MIKVDYLTKLQRYFIGLLAEYLVMIRMILAGYRHLARRYKDFYSEVDLIMSKGKEIVFIEIKYRSTFDKNPYNTISYKQIARIGNAMQNIMSKFPSDYSCRLDLVVIRSLFAKPVYFKNITNS